MTAAFTCTATMCWGTPGFLLWMSKADTSRSSSTTGARRSCATGRYIISGRSGKRCRHRMDS
jgi:hypothetical protein